MAFVLDASVAVQWYLGEEASAADKLLDRVRSEGAYAPALFRWEMQNVLLSAERASRIESEDLDDALDSLRNLPIHIDPPGEREFVGSEVRFARLYKLSSYDAAYLSLAAHLSVPLATTDSELAYAARDLGIPVLP